ncbi:MAG: hypothetical protein LBM98_04925 [Oscillospiraceae bacterium]|nr:hypothetical protein [Oscillospiraceae bacterium]
MMNPRDDVGIVPYRDSASFRTGLKILTHSKGRFETRPYVLTPASLIFNIC